MVKCFIIIITIFLQYGLLVESQLTKNKQIMHIFIAAHNRLDIYRMVHYRMFYKPSSKLSGYIILATSSMPTIHKHNVMLCSIWNTQFGSSLHFCSKYMYVKIIIKSQWQIWEFLSWGSIHGTISRAKWAWLKMLSSCESIVIEY